MPLKQAHWLNRLIKEVDFDSTIEAGSLLNSHLNTIKAGSLLNRC